MDFDFENARLLPPETVKNFGRTLIVAPHPDDESLGCGGAIALLHQFEIEVFALTLSDGTLSHPNSKKYPSPALRDLREREMIDALQILGVEKSHVEFFRLKDRSVPNREAADFARIVERTTELFEVIKPETVFVPWRRDPHPDHRAANEIVCAVREKAAGFKIVEYPIWLWELAIGEDAPRSDEVNVWRLNIAAVHAQKQLAIAAHKSQVTDLIDDDQHGFRLTPQILQHFDRDWEVYFETIR